MEPISRGTGGSNPSPSSGESDANLIDQGRPNVACWYASAQCAVRSRTRFTPRSSRSRTGMEQARERCWFRKFGRSQPASGRSPNGYHRDRLPGRPTLNGLERRAPRRAASLALFLAGRRPDGRAPIIPTANEWSSTLQKRPTAVVVIYSASILHIVEAFILAESKAAVFSHKPTLDLVPQRGSGPPQIPAVPVRGDLAERLGSGTRQRCVSSPMADGREPAGQPT